MATSPCTVTLVTNTSSSQSFDVFAGVTKLTLQITAGGMMYGKIERDGNIVVELDPQFTFNPNPTTHNYSAMVTSVDSNQTVTPPADGLLTITRPRPPWCPPRWFIRLLLVGVHNLSGSSDHNPLLHSQSLTFAFAFSPLGSKINGGCRLKRRHCHFSH